MSRVTVIVFGLFAAACVGPAAGPLGAAAPPRAATAWTPIALTPRPAASIVLPSFTVDGSLGASLRLTRADAPGLGLRSVVVGGEGVGSYATSADGLVRRFVVGGTDILEEVRSLGGDRIEQRWHVAEEPGGDEALEIRLEIPRARIELDGEGAVIHGDGGDYRCSAAVWIDAHEVTTPVAMELAHGGIRWRVPRRLLAQSRYPAMLDPIIEPVFDLAPHVPGSAFADQVAPRVSFNGERWVVVWSDTGLGTEAEDVWANTVELDGTLGSSTGWPVFGDTVRQTSAGIAFDGTQHLVVFSSLSGISGRWLDLTGAPVGDPFTIIADGGSNPRVAFDGSVFLLVYSARRGGSTIPDVFSVRLGTDGLPLDPAPTVLEDTRDTESYPDVAAVPGHFLVVWRSNTASVSRAHAVRISALDGQFEDPAPWALNTDTQPSPPAVTSIGGAFLPVWTPRIVGSPIVTQRLAPDGTWIDLAPYSVSPTSRNATFPSVACSGERCWIGHALNRTSFDLQAVFDEVLAPAAGSLASGVHVERPAWSNSTTAVGANATTALGVWDLDGAIDSDVLALRMDTSGALDPAPLVLSGGSPLQRLPFVVWSGSRYLVTWLERVAGEEVRLATRVGRDGDVLDTPFELGFPGTSFVDVFAHAGDYYLVGREDGPSGVRVLVQRMAGDGTLRGAPFEIPTVPGTVGRFASYGDGFVEVWASGWRRFSTDGTPLGVVPPTEPLFNGSLRPVGTADLFYLPMSRSSPPEVRVIRLGHDGTRLEPAPIPLVSDDRGAYFDATSDGGGLAVAWYRSTGAELRMARLGADGVPLDPPAGVLLRTGLANSSVRLVFDGSRYLIGYRSVRRVELLSLSGDGTPDPAPVVLADVGDQIGIATTGDLSSLVVWQEAAQEVPYRTYRIRGAIVRSVDTTGEPCVSDAECSGAWCVDGVCCSTACGGGDPSDCAACSVAAGATIDGTCAPREVGTACRAADGACDVAEACDGTSIACPVDAFASDTTVCRPAAGPCDVDDRCDGVGASCPADGLVADGTTCGGPVCGDARCVAGACTTGSLSCDDGDACTVDECVEPTGCSATPIAECCDDASDCDDGDVCTADRCDGDRCAHEAMCIDAGIPDAGHDAGLPDAGTPDAPVDAGVDAGVPVTPPTGCGCRIGAARPLQAWLAVIMMLAFAGRWRARSRPR